MVTRTAMSHGRRPSNSEASAENDGVGETRTGGERQQQRQRVAEELRDSVNGSLVNVGVLAALMMALAGAIYVDPPPGECYGEPLLKVELMLIWIAMGFFFFATIGALVLYMDLEGIPTQLLLTHLSNGAELVYCLPHIATGFGIFLTAIGYGIDIGERAGCPFLIFGLIAAPLFVFSIVALWILCRRRRQQLLQKHMGAETSGNGIKVGASFLATWVDRVPFSGISA